MLLKILIHSSTKVVCLYFWLAGVTQHPPEHQLGRTPYGFWMSIGLILVGIFKRKNQVWKQFLILLFLFLPCSNKSRRCLFFESFLVFFWVFSYYNMIRCRKKKGFIFSFLLCVFLLQREEEVLDFLGVFLNVFPCSIKSRRCFYWVFISVFLLHKIRRFRKKKLLLFFILFFWCVFFLLWEEKVLEFFLVFLMSFLCNNKNTRCDICFWSFFNVFSCYSKSRRHFFFFS
jgi:hypothetical protein